jgi:hypothetical protein
MKATPFSCRSTECIVPPLTLSAESEKEEENLERKDADLVQHFCLHKGFTI